MREVSDSFLLQMAEVSGDVALAGARARPAEASAVLE
jgi:hypothetical protein